MNLLLITLGSLALLALVAALVSKLTKGSNDAVQPTHGDCSTCSGEDDRCEQVCYMEAATRDIEYYYYLVKLDVDTASVVLVGGEYYDDEELDQYKGRPSDSYNDDEVQHFADVLFSLRPEDARGWARSLSLREINLPDALKDDLFALIEG